LDIRASSAIKIGRVFNRLGCVEVAALKERHGRPLDMVRSAGVSALSRKRLVTLLTVLDCF
jgi:hypothetical protein